MFPGAVDSPEGARQTAPDPILMDKMSGRSVSATSSPALRPQSLLLLLAALVPYDGLLLLVPALGGLGPWKEALVLATLASAFQQRDRRVQDELPMWFAPAIGLLALALLSGLLNPGLQSIAGLKIGFFYLITVPAVLWLAPFEPRDRDRLVTILMTNAVIVSIVGIGQQFLGHEALDQLGYEYDSAIRFTQGWMRSFSTFNQPFPFAFFVMIAMLIGVPVALEERRRLRNRIFLWSQPLLVVGVLLSFVRGALLGLVVGFVYLGFTRYRVLARVLVLLPLGAIVVVAAGGAAAVLSTSSLEARTTGWVAEIFDQGVEPLGQGIGTTSSAAELFLPDPDVFPPTGPSDTYQPDNYFVKTLIELGPIGAWLFVWLLVLAIRHAKRSTDAAASRSDLGLANGITAMIIASIPVGLISSYWEIFPVDLFFWMLVGVIPSIEHPSSSTPCSSNPRASAGVSRSTVAF